ncbi:hypothetical protein AB0N09_41575 [Streptomyces erythrochromogenes]|uniref:hypothetical protein n=1 Tax=Streptomyces erythrochromogenes TaxID=285574 RepID=UPI00344534E5
MTGMRKLLATPIVTALAMADTLAFLAVFAFSLFGVLLPAGADFDPAFFLALLVAVVAYGLVKLPLPGARRAALDCCLELADRIADWAGFEYIPDPN